MSEYFHDDDLSGLDLEAIANEYFGVEVAEDQVLNFTGEFSNPQALDSSETPGVDGPQQDVLFNGQVQLPDGLDDLFEDEEPLPSLERSAGNLQEIDQPADGLDDRGILPDFDWNAFASPEWKDFRERAADMELEEILGSDFLPASSNQTGSAVQHPDPSDVQGAATVIIPAANPPTAADYEAVNDESPDESDEEPEEVNAPDPPEFETYEENDPLINPDPPQKNWGRTGRRNGQEVWFNPETSLWQPSASHHDMRATLIERAQAEYPNDRYLHPDPTDGLPHGETAFFKPHQNRGPDRDQCADELFVWREYKSKKDENGKPIRRAKPIFSIRDHPGFMYEGDRILLDPHNNPVVNHKFIPLTLSAYTDGGKLQEMALKPGYRQLDLWARMPRWEKKTDKNGNSEIISLRDKNTRINMPMTRFREKKGTLAGGDREGTEKIMEGLTRFYHHHGFDPVASGNSVKAFPRDLTPSEVKEARLGNTARFGKRAGNRALDDEKREDNLQKTLKAIENGKKKQAAKDGNTSGKRRLEDDAESSQGPSAGAQKRRRRGQEVDPGLTALNEGYAPHQEASTVQGSRNDVGFLGNVRDQPRGYPQVSRPPQVGINAYGATRAPYQRSDLQAQRPPVQNTSSMNSIYPSIGTSSNPAQRRAQQAPYGGVNMQAARSPYENAQAQTPLNHSSQYPPSTVGTGRVPTVRPVEPRQGPRVDNYHEYPRNTAQGGPMSQINPGQYPRGPVSGNSYGPPVERQEPHEANAAPRRTGNTLGLGGRGLHRAPQQVLGKRGHRVVDEVGDQVYGTQQRPINIEGTRDSDFSAPPKRRRTDENYNTVAPQQRQRRPERTLRPNHYGAKGAPTPLLPPNEFFGSPQPTPLYNGNEEGSLMSPEEVSRQLGGVFGGPSPMPTLNQSTSQHMGGAPTRHSGYVQRTPQGFEPQQVLGKHRREDPMEHRGENPYAPQPNLGQQGPGRFHGAPEQEIHMPQPKRRRMPDTEGYYAPPVQAPQAQVVKKARNRERDARLPSPQLQINQPAPNLYQAPHMEGARRMLPQNNYTNGAPIYNNASAPNTHAQGQPLAPIPPQVSQQAHFDVRDVLPSNGQESQSIHNALSYTRDVFHEWTGLESPVTNLEDSYNVQYREIRAAFRVWWRSGNNPQRRDPVPELWRMPPWRGTIEDWGAS